MRLDHEALAAADNTFVIPEGRAGCNGGTFVVNLSERFVALLNEITEVLGEDPQIFIKTAIDTYPDDSSEIAVQIAITQAFRDNLNPLFGWKRSNEQFGSHPWIKAHN